MLEGFTVKELRLFSGAGAGLEIDGSAYTADELRTIAMVEPAAKCPLIIHNSASKTPDELRLIAKAGKGRVIFT